MADAALDLDLRLRRAGHIARTAARSQPRLAQNLRQLGAVGAYVPPPGAGSQTVVVKGWITNGKNTRDHLHYLQHEKGQEKNNARLFGSEAQGLNPEKFIQDALKDTHQFRMAISLEQHPRFFPMRVYVEALMEQVTRDLGRKTDWVAAVHHDTAHPHAHIVLRGADRDGNPLHIKNDYLTHGVRYRAAQMATWLLGPTQDRTREHSRESEKTPQHVTAPTIEPATKAQRGMER